MAGHEDWVVQAPERGWLNRLVVPQTPTRPATAPLVIGALGALAFVASMALDWQSVTWEIDLSSVSTSVVVFSDRATLGSANVTADNIFEVSTLGLVYGLGGIALFGVAGAAVAGPWMALRVRLAATGVAIGLLGVLVAAVIRLPRGSESVVGVPANRVTTSYEPGIFFGFAAVILPVIAIWIASLASARDAVGDEPRSARHRQASPPASPESGRPVEITVSPSEPLDLTVTPGHGPISR